MNDQRGRRWLIVGCVALAALSLALIYLAPALAAPPPRPPRPTRPPQPTQPTHPRQTTTTVAPTTTTLAPTTTTSTTTTTLPPTTTTTTLPPTTTTVAPTTTTRAIIFLEGTAVLFGINDPEGRNAAIIYGADFVGLPLFPGSDPPTVRACPTGTVLDFSASTFTVDGQPIGTSGPINVSLFEFGNPAIIAQNNTDATVTVVYRIACV
jgi:hypothetical protein